MPARTRSRRKGFPCGRLESAGLLGEDANADPWRELVDGYPLADAGSALLWLGLVGLHVHGCRRDRPEKSLAVDGPVGLSSGVVVLHSDEILIDAELVRAVVGR